MKVAEILKAKGSSVEWTSATASIMMAVHKMRLAGIGSLVVSEDGDRVEGILSERDIVRGLTVHGAELLDKRVADVMEGVVAKCSPEDSIKHVMVEMTQRRVRHVPVVADGKLCGIVSIGDIVKNRLDELALETDVLRTAYLANK